MFNFSKGHVSRRSLLGTFGAAISLASPALATIAGPDADDRGSGRDGSPGDGTAPDVIFRQSYLGNVSNEDLSAAIRMNRTGGRVVVAGFSKRMSSTLFMMLLLRRRRTLYLINKLKNESDRDDRRHILYEASDGISNSIFLINETEAHEVFFPSDKETLKKLTAIRRLRHYQSLLDIWRRNPMEGTLETPGLRGS